MQTQISFLSTTATPVTTAATLQDGLVRLDQAIVSEPLRASFATVLADDPASEPDKDLSVLNDPDTQADQSDPESSTDDEAAKPKGAALQEDVKPIQTTREEGTPPPLTQEPNSGAAELADQPLGTVPPRTEAPNTLQPILAKDVAPTFNVIAPEAVEPKPKITARPSPVDLWQTVVLPSEPLKQAIPVTSVIGATPVDAPQPGNRQKPAPANDLHPVSAAPVKIATEGAGTTLLGKSDVASQLARTGEGTVPLQRPPTSAETPITHDNQLRRTDARPPSMDARPATPTTIPEISAPLRQQPPNQPGAATPNALPRDPAILRGAKGAPRNTTPQPDAAATVARPVIAGTKQVMPLTSWQTNTNVTTEQFTAKELTSLDPIVGDARGATVQLGSSATTLPSRPELPPYIARQLAEVVQQQPNRPVEISLKPQELGAVRLSIQQAETGIVVNLTAERPETLDLMRRNIDQLGADFRELGYTSIAFSFAGADTDADPQNQQDSTATFEQPDAEDTQTPHATHIHLTQTTVAGGVDLRL